MSKGGVLDGGGGAPAEGDTNVLPRTGAVGRCVTVAPTDPVTSWESSAQSMYVVGSLLFCGADCFMQAVVPHGGEPVLFLLEDSQFVSKVCRMLWDVGRRAGAAVGKTVQGAELQEMHT